MTYSLMIMKTIIAEKTWAMTMKLMYIKHSWRTKKLGARTNMSYEIPPPGFCSSSIQFTNMALYVGAYVSWKSASSSEKFTRIVNPLSNCGDFRYTSSNNLTVK